MAAETQLPQWVIAGDALLIRSWLHGRPPTTARAYLGDALALMAHAGVGLADVRLDHLQDWHDALGSASPATRARRLAAARSLLAHAAKLGYIATDPGRLLRVAKPSTVGADRILAETDVQRMIGTEADARSRAALRLLYLGGLRAAELCALRWRDMSARKAGGEAKILGKGGKVRTIAISAALWRELVDLMPAPRPDSPVIPSRSGASMTVRALHRLVKRAARRAGLGTAPSPHWLRHSHASHALDRGAPVHVVQQQLGHASLATTTRYAHARRGDSSTSYLPD